MNDNQKIKDMFFDSIFRGDFQTLQSICRYNSFDIDTTTDELKNGLLIAIQYNPNFKIIEFLVDYGINIDNKDENGDSYFEYITRQIRNKSLIYTAKLYAILEFLNKVKQFRENDPLWK